VTLFETTFVSQIVYSLPLFVLNINGYVSPILCMLQVPVRLEKSSHKFYMCILRYDQIWDWNPTFSIFNIIF
jgi:hypothetical protein